MTDAPNKDLSNPDRSNPDLSNKDGDDCHFGPVQLDDAEATLQAGRNLARQICAAGRDRLTIFLAGDLGAGKTTFARGFLEALGHAGRVPSPTYTLIEPYDLDDYLVYHVDLYRLADSRDVDDLGLAELPGPGVILLIEWPERAGARLEPADLVVALEVPAAGRRMAMTAATAAGRHVLGHEYIE